MQINRWWDTDPRECYWLEVTDRDDLGADLHAPQRKDNDEEYYGYSLIQEIRNDEFIVHYHKDEKAIVAISRATGSPWSDDIVWGAHGTTARNTGVQPYQRKGWRLGLVNFTRITPSIALADIRTLQLHIQEVRAQLEQRYQTSSLYFPFELSDKREVRPTQAYLTKLPADIVMLMPPLADALHALPSGTVIAHAQTYPSASVLGATYRRAEEEYAISQADPFTVDPALVERANRGHAATQNALADYLLEREIIPRSPAPGEPNFDLAWVVDSTIFVAEIKSITDDNEEKQLRLGLGQVLRYRQQLCRAGYAVQACLVLERPPRDESWVTLCKDLAIALTWPPSFKLGL